MNTITSCVEPSPIITYLSSKFLVMTDVTKGKRGNHERIMKFTADRPNLLFQLPVGVSDIANFPIFFLNPPARYLFHFNQRLPQFNQLEASRFPQVLQIVKPDVACVRVKKGDAGPADCHDKLNLQMTEFAA